MDICCCQNIQNLQKKCEKQLKVYANIGSKSIHELQSATSVNSDKQPLDLREILLPHNSLKKGTITLQIAFFTLNQIKLIFDVPPIFKDEKEIAHR